MLLALPVTASHAACVEVIAHRGASGYLPEHSLPAYALGYGQGADWIEPDLVLTADGVPVALHDLTLDRITNVVEVFPERARDDGRYHVADFTYAEIQQLLLVEAQPGRFPHQAFHIPRLGDVLDLVDGLNRTTGRRVGIYPELKSPGLQPGLADAMLKALANHELPVLIQSFDPSALAALATDHERVQLIASADQASNAALDGFADYAIGIGAPKQLLHNDPTLVRRSHQRGLKVHVYTLRADRVGAGFTSLEDEVKALTAMGVDAMFTDHPDQVLAILEQHLGRQCGPSG